MLINPTKEHNKQQLSLISDHNQQLIQQIKQLEPTASLNFTALTSYPRLNQQTLFALITTQTHSIPQWQYKTVQENTLEAIFDSHPDTLLKIMQQLITKNYRYQLLTLTIKQQQTRLLITLRFSNEL